MKWTGAGWSLAMWCLVLSCGLPMSASIITNHSGKSGHQLLSGTHALHQYHAWMGAKGILEKGNPSVYDPVFHAGYIKTPLFDSQSFAVEWIGAIKSIVIDEGNPPSPEEIANLYACFVGLISITMPVCAGLGCRLAGFGRVESLVSAVAISAVMSTPIGVRAMADGELGQVLAPGWFILFIGSLIAFHRGATFQGGLCAFSSYGLLWSTSVATAVLATGMVLYFYLRAGLRHKSLWHFSLIACLALAIVANLGLFLAWKDHWWIQATLVDESAFGPGNAFFRVLEDSRWGGKSGLAAAGVIVASGLVGSQWLVWTGRRLSGRMIATAIALLLLLFTLGKSAHILAPLDTVANPAAIMLVSCMGTGSMFAVGGFPRNKWIGPEYFRNIPGRLLPAFLVMISLATLSIGDNNFLLSVCSNWLGGSDHLVSRPPFSKTLCDKLLEYPDHQGRILWEDIPGDVGNGWAVLLPSSTQKPMIGGLSPVAHIEHMQASLRDGRLAGRSVLDWTDSELGAFIKAYRISFVVARNSDSIGRWSRFADSEIILKDLNLQNGQGWVVFKLAEQPGIAVVGQARIVHLGSDKITLADVFPENGSVVLSLHYQRGMKVRPGRARIERELDSHDPIPLIRLRLDEPVSRLELEWEDR